MVAPSDRRVYYTTLASNGYHPTGRTTPGAGNQYAREICIPRHIFFPATNRTQWRRHRRVIAHWEYSPSTWHAVHGFAHQWTTTSDVLAISV